MSTRFAPSVDLDIGTAILVETDLVKADVDFAVTEKVPMITLELNDSAKKYSSLLHWNDTITLSAEGDVRFLGRIDSYIPSYNKQGARILTVKGRHTGSAALEDYVANLQVSGTPHAIVHKIIDTYTTMKGSTYTADPAITLVTNSAPDDITLGFDWRRKSFWKMFSELQQALGSPVAEGGKDEFYDFFFNPATLGDFYFLPVGTIDSSVTIPESTETLHAKRTLDGLPVKNNIFVWAHATAGAVPYQMQIGWNKAQHYEPAVPGLTDPWTEGNASDYDGHNNSEKPDPTIANYPIPPIAYGEDRMVGSQCIRISGVIGSIGGMGSIPPIMRSAYWYMNFAHGGKFHTKLSGFTNQDPNDMLNLSNETHMSESMGEVSAMAFYLKTLSDTWSFEVQLVDVNNHRVQSQTISSKQTSGTYYNPYDRYRVDWVPLSYPIGPSASGWKLISAADETFDWTSIKQIRFVFGGKLGLFDFLFDGFRFIKPLIAQASYISAEVQEKTCRSLVVPKEKIVDYEAALLIAQAQLEEQKQPNVYWDIENLGRVDIPSGSKFKIGTLELLLRDQKWTMTKEGGWTISGTALEQT